MTAWSSLPKVIFKAANTLPALMSPLLITKTASKTRVFVTAALLAWGSIGLVGSASSAEPGSQLAVRIEKMLSQMKETAYQGATEINEETGSLKCDCSGLVCYALRDMFPEAYLSVRGMEAQARVRPMSITFYETFAAAAAGKGNGRWQAVEKLMDIKPGDILAWRKDVIEEGESSGHTAMVAGKPVLEKDGRVRVRVIDSTRGPHSNDTRTETTLGVGSGDMYFTADRDGRPSGFYVRGDGPLSKLAFAFGRMVDLGDAASPVLDIPKDADFIGLDLTTAKDLASTRKLESRVIDQDGKVMPVTARLSGQRINFVLRAGKVIRALRG
jgi:hypothetical protein